MASFTDRYFDSGQSVKRAFRISFIDKAGKRKAVQFPDEEVARYFYAEITKKEQRWRADRLLSLAEGDGS